MIPPASSFRDAFSSLQTVPDPTQSTSFSQESGIGRSIQESTVTFEDGQDLIFAKGRISADDALQLKTEFLQEMFPDYLETFILKHDFYKEFGNRIFSMLFKLTYNSDEPEECFRKRLRYLTKNINDDPDFKEALINKTHSTDRLTRYALHPDAKRKRRKVATFKGTFWKDAKNWKRFDCVVRFWDERIQTETDISRLFDFKKNALRIRIKNGYLTGMEGFVIGVEPFADRANIQLDNGRKLSLAYDDLLEQGHFLVRLTEPQKGAGMKLVLSVRWNKRSYHFIINYEPPKYYIERFQFDNIVDLINFYVQRKVPVTEKSGAMLLQPVPRQDWEITHDVIELDKMLGEGAFGAVHTGIWNQKDGPKKVAVKVHKGKALTKEIIKEICAEARTMRKYKHPNVVAFYGVVIEREPIMLVMELVTGGALDSYLAKHGSEISLTERISFSVDAARGLEYLHDKNCIHRDVSARNCLVNDGRVKISDFGLSRNVSNQAKAYKLKNLKQKLPIRWLSPETLVSATYTTKSDVFSFGVLLWEIFSDGREPYPGLTAAEVNAQVKIGYRMSPPDTMPRPMRHIMEQNCWCQLPEERSTMIVIRKALEEFQQCNSSKKSKDKAEKTRCEAAL
uniref:Tyrosine-protein kinase n=1 Tax=Panagrolaimus sp. JU765 TaxID=591449 RepID=A0AC34R5A2_9BILA